MLTWPTSPSTQTSRSLGAARSVLLISPVSSPTDRMGRLAAFESACIGCIGSVGCMARSLDAGLVLARSRVGADGVADLDEQRNLDDQATLGRGRLARA